MYIYICIYYKYIHINTYLERNTERKRGQKENKVDLKDKKRNW